MKPLLPLTGIVAGFLISSAGAATLSGTVTTTGLTSTIDLTATGTTNWAVWHYTSGGVTAANSIVPSNRMSGGPGSSTTAGFISNAYRVGGTGTSTIRGGNGQTLDLTYSNAATGPASGSINNVRMVFSSDLDSTANGVGVAVTGDPNQLYKISVWASGLDGQGTMTASAPGFTDVTLLSQTYGASGGDGEKVPTLFTFLFQPNNVNDILTMNYVLTTNGAGINTSHVGISAVTVEVVPEPGSVALGALGSLALLRRRRG